MVEVMHLYCALRKPVQLSREDFNYHDQKQGYLGQKAGLSPYKRGSDYCFSRYYSEIG